jgi:hypothetical protein
MEHARSVGHDIDLVRNLSTQSSYKLGELAGLCLGLSGQFRVKLKDVTFYTGLYICEFIINN